MKIVLKGERPTSWNKVYEGKHWAFRKQLADSVHAKVRAELNRMGIKIMDKKTLFEKPVDIEITAYFDKRPIDADNIGAKLYIDPLKFSVIFDDSPKYVSSVKTMSRIDKVNPRLEIVIEEKL